MTCEVKEPGRFQTLRSHIDDFVLPGFRQFQRFSDLSFCQGAVDVRGVNAGFIEGLNLVHHQGNQGRDHHRNSRHQKRRDLIAQRFSRPGRHNGEDVFPGQDLVDNLLLPRTEGVIAEICFQSLFLLIFSFIHSVCLLKV